MQRTFRNRDRRVHKESSGIVNDGLIREEQSVDVNAREPESRVFRHRE